jgi:hypothetical protein
MIAQRYPLHVVQQARGHVDPRSTQVDADLSDMQLRHELERHRRWYCQLLDQSVGWAMICAILIA